MTLLMGTIVVSAALAFGLQDAASTGPAPTAEFPRIRTTDARIATAMRDAAERSSTFRRLVDAIRRTDGIVYIEAGRCGIGLGGCLRFGAVAGPNRILHITVSPSKDGPDTGTIAHELQHALEVLSNSMVTSARAMSLHYMHTGVSGGMDKRLRETAAAVNAGNAVRAELRRKPPGEGRPVQPGVPAMSAITTLR